MLERQTEMEAYEQEQAQRRSQDASAAKPPAEETPPASANFDTARVVDTMKKFVEGMSSYEGAEVPGRGGGAEGQEVNFDMDKFMGELEAALGLDSRGGEGEGESEESRGGLESDLDSDMDWDEEGGSEEEGAEMGRSRPEAVGPGVRMRGAREVGRDTSEGGESDSDDSFMEEYGEVSCHEALLPGSLCLKSFVHFLRPC
jgi:hypothetical protein